MLRRCDKPQCFAEIDEDFMYIEAYDDSPYAYAALAIGNDVALMHLEIVRWSHTTLKRLYVDWDDLKKLMVENGAKKLAIVKPGVLTKKYEKFLKKFGLSPPQQVVMATYDLR